MAVPGQWCGGRIDSADLARPAELAQLPQEFTFEEYRIYIRREALGAFVRMAGDAARDSIRLIVDSGFRSPDFQRRIFQRRMAEGKSFAAIARVVAPPGYSQHHTGRAVDLVPSESAFQSTDAYLWLRDHAAQYGFIEAYPDDSLSAHPWEPWHWLYLPADSAR